MKNSLLIFFMGLSIISVAQKRYWQQKADFTIVVQLNDTANTLEGFETLHYFNNSPDTLDAIWFHLWPNAYKNDRTAFSNQLLQLGNTDFYFSSKEQRGYINRLDFKVNGVTAKTEDHPEHIDIIKLLLPAPLAPAAQLTITTPFHVKLPYLFSRGGYGKGSFQLTQWYPKPAVYDAQGWHPMPYLEQGEFYSEFGNYDVTITLPKDYVVAATGLLQNRSELQWLKNKTAVSPNQNQPPAQLKNKYGHLKKLPVTNSKKTLQDTTVARKENHTKTLQFKQQDVHDFALFANKAFIVDADTCKLASGKIIDVKTFYFNLPGTAWKKSLQFTKEALRFYSDAVGDYPYASMQVAECPVPSGGGMEYPALTIIGPVASTQVLDRLIAHEVGHNWFFGALATNEREAPWMDEGINTFYEQKYFDQKYGSAMPGSALGIHMLVQQKKDQPITTSAANFSSLNYNLVAYDKAAQWMALVEQKAGPERFRQTMQQYFKEWRFKHPQENDLKSFLSTALPDTALFKLLDRNGALPNQSLAPLKILSPLVPATIKNYVRQPAKNAWLLSPAAGFNNYDKVMIGGLFTNYGLSPTAFQFIAVPLYATGAKKWNGIGSIKYNWYTGGRFYKIEAALTGMGFSKSYMTDSNHAPHFERFFKIAPSLRFIFNQAPGSTKESWLEAKPVFIRETNFAKFVTASNALTYVDSLAKESRTINQLTYNVNDYRALYPYQYTVQLQQAQAFYRINLTGHYFFNYASGGGAGVRLFVAKFGYLTSDVAKRFTTTRYQPKLLGVTGEEDYTYSAYFVGRTASYANDAAVVKNSGLAAQQIMLRDGAFKWRMDQFDFLQGRSDNWVASLNFNTTLPHQLLPAVIPLKLFLDVGTYAGTTQNESISNRILYVGGLQLSLLKNSITIYAPVIYSSVFRDNLKSLLEQNTFLKRLTFSIDLHQLSTRQLSHNKFWF